MAKGDTVIIECTYGDAASASISASYIPPRVKPAPTATEMAYVPNYGAQREIDFSGWPGGSGTGVIEGDIFVVQETGWYLFYYAPLVSVSQPWSISTNLVVDGKIVDVNWVLTPAQTNAAFAMPMKLTWMEKGSIANIMVTCGGPGFSIQQSVNCLVLFCPPQEIVPPLVDMNNYPTNIQLSDALNTYAASLDDLYATKQELQDHITNDKGYWQTLLQVQNISVANQALLTQQQTTINSLLARVSELENNPVEPTPTYDMSNPTILKTPPLIGLLGLEIGGTNEIGTGWTSPSNGLVIVDGASTIGLLTPNWIAVNGTHVDPSNSASAVLTLIGGGGSGQFTVAADDIITESGMGNVTFYPEIG